MKNEVKQKWTQKWSEEKRELEGNFHVCVCNSSKFLSDLLFIHAVTQPVFFEQQLYARHCAKQ